MTRRGTLSPLQFDCLDLTNERILVFLKETHRLKCLVRESGKTEDVALRELERAVPGKIEREDARISVRALLVAGERRRWRVVTDPALHVGQDHDAIVCALRALEDRVEVRAAVWRTSSDLTRECERGVAAV